MLTAQKQHTLPSAFQPPETNSSHLNFSKGCQRDLRLLSFCYQDLLDQLHLRYNSKGLAGC